MFCLLYSKVSFVSHNSLIISLHLYIRTGVQKYTRKDTPRPADFAKKPFQARQDPSHIFAEEEEEEGDDSDDKDDEEKEDAVDGAEIGDEITRTITKVYEEVCINPIY